jgi:hypothetical protein
VATSTVTAHKLVLPDLLARWPIFIFKIFCAKL